MLKRSIKLCGAMLLLLLMSSGCASFGGPYRGLVRDFETREPIEGAVVVVVWYQQYYTPAGRSAEFYDAVEVLTDKDGKFYVPWYFKFYYPPIISYLDDPQFTIFKPEYGVYPGYQISPVSQTSYNAFFFKKKLGSLDKRMPGDFMGFVELRKLRTREERLRSLDRLPPGINVPYNKMRTLIELMNKEEIDLGLHPPHIKGDGK